MKRLTAYGTILVVITTIAGIYGMNFKFMPELVALRVFRGSRLDGGHFAGLIFPFQKKRRFVGAQCRACQEVREKGRRWRNEMLRTLPQPVIARITDWCLGGRRSLCGE